jgi:hypothetical protein
MGTFARRFAPDRGLVLDDGARVDCRDGACCPSGSVIVDDDGAVRTLAAGEWAASQTPPVGGL